MSAIARLAASAVITDAEGRFLLVKRGHAPAMGVWSLPGGGVEPGEALEQTLHREVLEETGLVVSVGQEVWQLVVPLAPGHLYEVHAFAADVRGGSLLAGDDAREVGWFSVCTLDQMSLTPHLAEFLRDYTPSSEPRRR